MAAISRKTLPAKPGAVNLSWNNYSVSSFVVSPWRMAHVDDRYGPGSAPRIKCGSLVNRSLDCSCGAEMIRILCNELMPDGKIALYKGSAAVWVGPVGSPIEDVDFDEIMLSPNDYRILNDPKPTSP